MRQYITIPNMMGYFRILLIPIYIVLYLNAETAVDYYIAAGVIALSAITDFFDGKIARKFNQVTDFGKILDPIADKLTQGTLAICLSLTYPYMRVLLVVFIIKEFAMGITGLVYMRRGWRTDGAMLIGKISTWVLDLSLIVLVLLPEIKLSVANGIMIFAIVVMVVSLLAYVQLYYHVHKKFKQGVAGEDIDMEEIHREIREKNHRKGYKDGVGER